MLTIAFLFSTFTPLAAAEKEQRPLIQIAILLDTSNSMDGLIHQAKTQLWKIVNELATAHKEGKTPELQVALFEYGKSSIPAKDGHLRMVLNLTTDLDKVSEELFALKTNGGDEYCGWVINEAVKQLKWSESKADFKAIYIAGNEAFTQMPGRYNRIHFNAPQPLNNPYNNRANKQVPNKKRQVQVQQQQVQIQQPKAQPVDKDIEEKNKHIQYKAACTTAVAKGIIVNTIHCGSLEEGVNGKWRDGAILGKGVYMNIDQNRKTVDIKSPQDEKIMKLNDELNKTYIPFGAHGKSAKSRQMAQDKNMQKSSYSGNMQRAMSKASVHYRNASWDLVDAVTEKNVEIEKLKDEQLPENMKKMSVEERKKFVADHLAKRRAIQKQIQELNDARKKFVAAEMKKLSASGEDTLDAAMVKSLRKQLQEKDFQFKK